MNNRKAFSLAFLALCIAILALVPAVAAQRNSRPAPVPAPGLAFQSPILTPPMCPPGQTRPACITWRPTPPPITPTPETADAGQMHYVFLPLVLR